MNFVACDGTWLLAGLDNALTCQGVLHTVTSEEMTALGGLTWEDVQQYSSEVLTLFCIAFAFAVLRKLL